MKKKSTTIYTRGKHIAGLPFQGELMTCVMCGKLKKSNPKKESNWRAIAVDGETFYVCPNEFPPDTASASEFQAAYTKILLKILNRQKGH